MLNSAGKGGGGDILTSAEVGFSVNKWGPGTCYRCVVSAPTRKPTSLTELPKSCLQELARS